MISDWLKSTVPTAMERFLGRRLFARVSRYLWRKAQLDAYDDFRTNGESLLQRGVFDQRPDALEVTVVDVGANLGQWSGELIENARRSGPPSRLYLHAFEPSEAARCELRKQLVDTDEAWLQLEIHSEAVDCETGTAEFSRSAPTAGTNSLVHDPEEHTEGTVEVDTITIDDFCEREGIDHIDFLKVDAEGNDLNALLGASAMLSESRVDLVQFEYSRRWIDQRCYLRDAFEFFDEHGYDMGKVTQRGVELHERWQLELENFWLANFVACRPSLEFPVESFPYWKKSR